MMMIFKASVVRTSTFLQIGSYFSCPFQLLSKSEQDRNAHLQLHKGFRQGFWGIFISILGVIELNMSELLLVFS